MPPISRWNLGNTTKLVSCTLLASKVQPFAYPSDRYEPPSSPEAAILDAGPHFEFVHHKTGQELSEAYLNGPRTLSDNRLCYLIVSVPSSSPPNPNPERASASRVTYEMIVCFAHTINDGTAGHYFMNELLALLGGPSTGSHPVISSDELSQVLEEEWESRWGLKGAKYSPEGFMPIPRPAEERMPVPEGRLRAAVETVAFQNSQRKDIVRFSLDFHPIHSSDSFSCLPFF